MPSRELILHISATAPNEKLDQREAIAAEKARMLRQTGTSIVRKQSLPDRTPGHNSVYGFDLRVARLSDRNTLWPPLCSLEMLSGQPLRSESASARATSRAGQPRST